MQTLPKTMTIGVGAGKTPPNNRGLELSPIHLNEDYRKKWNIHQNDFHLLTMNGVQLNNILYRKGGFFSDKDLKKDYFIILKHEEDQYSDIITKNKKEKHYLKSTWVIIDKFGNEKINFEPFKSPYLQGGVIYSLDSNYFNIETGEAYGSSTHGSVASDNFLFLDNKYHKDLESRGVWKIDKKTGTYEIYK